MESVFSILEGDIIIPFTDGGITVRDLPVPTSLGMAGSVPYRMLEFAIYCQSWYLRPPQTCQRQVHLLESVKHIRVGLSKQDSVSLRPVTSDF